MLRITTMTTIGSSVTLKLEGKIMADWVNLLERECRSVISERKACAWIVQMSAT